MDKGYEVLLLTEPVDEVWTQSVSEYGEKPLQSAGKGSVDLGSEEEKEQEKEERKEGQEKYGSLLERLKSVLDDHVKEVRLSTRLTASAACLVGDVSDMSPQLEKLMKSMSQPLPQTKRILELNPKHPILEKLQGIFETDQGAAELTDYAHLLHGQALLAEGGQPPDPGRFAKLVADLMVKAP